MNINQILNRSKAIITDPAGTWPQIANDGDTVKDIYTKYLLFLAAIGPIFGILGGILRGWHMIVPNIIGYILSLAGAFIGSLILAFISKYFDGNGDQSGSGDNGNSGSGGGDDDGNGPFIQMGPERLDVRQLASLSIVPDTSPGGDAFTIGHATGMRNDNFSTFPDFIAQLASDLASGNTAVIAVTASGRFDASSDTFTASNIAVLLTN